MPSPSTTSPIKRLTHEALPCCVIVLAGLIALWQYLFQGKALYWGDIELYFAPMQQLLRTNLDRGHIPLWNPYILCGQPFVGNPQTWLLYPSTLLLKWLSPWTFLTVTAAIHLILGGLLFYFLARDNQRSRISSVLAGIGFMLGGYFASKVQFPNMAQAIAYVPLILLLAGKLAKRPNFRNALVLGFAFGLQLLAAHAQVSVMSLYLATIYAVYRAWPELREQRGRWRVLIGWSVFAGLFAACLDAGQLLPVLELWKHSDRQILTLGVANRFVLSPNQITNFFWPNLYGSPYAGNFHHRGNYWETACYLGMLPSLLLVYAIALNIRRKASDTTFWTVILTTSVWLAFGKWGGLYDLAFYFAPAVKAFHDPARMLLGAAVAGPMLAAIGLDYLLRLKPTRQVRYGIAFGIILITALDLGVFVRHLYPLMPVAEIDAAVRANGQGSQLAILGDRVMFTPNERSTWKYFVDYSNFRVNDPTYFRSLLATHTPNIGMLNGVADAGGYEPEPVQGAVKRYVDAYKQHEKGDDSGLESLDVDSLISFQAKPKVSGTGFFGSHDQVGWTRPEIIKEMDQRWGRGFRTVEIPSYYPDFVCVTLLNGAGLESVVIPQSDFPGWHAYVGQQELPVRRTSDGLTRVIAPPGVAGRLSLRYQPESWVLGLYVTLAALAFALGFAVYTVLSPVRPVQ